MRLTLVVLLVVLSGACASSSSDPAASPGGVTTPSGPDAASSAPNETSAATQGDASSSSDPEASSSSDPAASDETSAAIPAGDSAHLELGAQVFASTCAGCHGQQALGTPKGPGLVGIAAREPDRAIQVSAVTYGTGEMLGRSLLLTPEEIDAVVSYIRLSFVALDSTDG